MSPIIVRDDLPPTPDWTFTPPQVQQVASLRMPLLWDGDNG